MPDDASEGRSRHGNRTCFWREGCPVPQDARSRVPTARSRTPESASPSKLPGRSVTVWRIGRGTRPMRHTAGTCVLLASEPTALEHGCRSEGCRRQRGPASAAPTHLGRRRGPKTPADQMPEHFPVDRKPGHGEAWLITPGSGPRALTRLLRTGLPRGERAAWAAAWPVRVAAKGLLDHRRYRPAHCGGRSRPVRSGHFRRVRSGQGFDELLPVDHLTLQHRYRLASPTALFPPACEALPHPGSRLPFLRQCQPPTRRPTPRRWA